MTRRSTYTPRHLPSAPGVTPVASLGIPAAMESIAIAGGKTPAEKRCWASTIAAQGRKFTPEARAYAARVAAGEAPVPTLDDVP